MFVFELQWILLVFAFWPHKKTGFGASELNKDTTHVLTAHKYPGCHPYHPCGCFLGVRFPKLVFENKNGKRRRLEREKRKSRKRRERRKGEEAPAISPFELPGCSACI